MVLIALCKQRRETRRTALSQSLRAFAIGVNMGRDVRNLSSVVSVQQRRKPAYASAQSDQRLFYLLIGKYNI